ncbi:MAG: MarR family transcriptional regulator [Solirubrobacterales bacterium]
MSSRADTSSPADAAAAWLALCDLVLDNDRRREVAEAVGISFARARAVRRLARRPMSMGELAAALAIDPPNATVVVDELEDLGLVSRGPHPSDGRAKLVSATPRGRELARRADEILATPPPRLAALGGEDLATLRRILAELGAE